jgi:hypothetical protein
LKVSDPTLPNRVREKIRQPEVLAAAPPLRHFAGELHSGWDQ